MTTQAELEKEIKEVDKYCPEELIDGGKWNRRDVLQAQLTQTIEMKKKIASIFMEIYMSIIDKDNCITLKLFKDQFKEQVEKL